MRAKKRRVNSTGEIFRLSISGATAAIVRLSRSGVFMTAPRIDLERRNNALDVDFIQLLKKLLAGLDLLGDNLDLFLGQVQSVFNINSLDGVFHMQTFLQSSIRRCQLQGRLFTFDRLWGFIGQGRDINYAYRGLPLS